MTDQYHPNDRPLYIISVAADLVNMHPQTLRLYERRGLVAPKRQGKNRLYSQHDIERLQYIQQLTQELGINLAGVEKIIRLQNELEDLKKFKEQELQLIESRLNALAEIKDAKEKDIKAIKRKIRESATDEEGHE
ncbi:MAG: helix-turn-helix transcriptional regulator [Candidatus Sericytochromatia bacterium]|nr:helix-turn-helix transcriptional regulator [Candidatus Sericytochromatia bacterium]